VVDTNSARCQRADLENIFISTNMLLGVNPYQARGTQTHAQLLAVHDRLSIAREYDMRGFLRFQFIAALVQTAINKFILSERKSRGSRGRSAAAADGGTTTTPKKREKPQTVCMGLTTFNVHSHTSFRGSWRAAEGSSVNEQTRGTASSVLNQARCSIGLSQPGSQQRVLL
jgi:hypothetical protein